MRKNTLKVLLVALTTTVFFGCGGGEKSKIDYIPFKTDRDGMWGMIDREGNILFEEDSNQHLLYAVKEFLLYKRKNQ